MGSDIALLLAQDGIVNGAVYGLIALAHVLVFAVTRVIFIPQGEFVAYGALTLASFQMGQTPGTVWLLLGGALCVAVIDLIAAYRTRSASLALRTTVLHGALPALIAAVVFWLAPHKPPMSIQIALTLCLVVPLGPIVYRLAFQPLANASTLVLLIVAVAVHFVMVGLGLLIFGAEGSRTAPISDDAFQVGVMRVSAQSLFIVGTSFALIGALYLLFERTILGKALRATAVNRIGARIVGISPSFSGALCFMLATLMGAVSGVLISSITTIYYDTGFLIGLKSFVGAILGGLISYPLAAAGALLVGLLESLSSYWASAYKEVIVFTLIVPVLVWRSFTSHVIEEEEEEE